MNSWYYPNLQMRKQSPEKSRSNIPVKCRCLFWISRSCYCRRHSAADLQQMWKEPPEESSASSLCSELHHGRSPSVTTQAQLLQDAVTEQQAQRSSYGIPMSFCSGSWRPAGVDRRDTVTLCQHVSNCIVPIDGLESSFPYKKEKKNTERIFLPLKKASFSGSVKDKIAFVLRNVRNS